MSLTRPHRTAAALAVALIAAGVLSGCTPDASADGASDMTRVQLTPNGDHGAWFSSAYASGVDGSYATANPVCGVTGTHVIERQEGPGFIRRVLARDIANGFVVWEIDNASCEDGGLLEGRVAVRFTPVDGASWHLIDANTGTAVEDLPFAADDVGVRPVTRAGDLVVYAVGGDRLVGVDGSTAVWTEAQPARGEVTPLADGYLGIDDPANDRVAVVDGRTGDTVGEQEVVYPQTVRWASDGFTLRVDQTDPEYAYYDVRGERVDRTVGASQYPFVPPPQDGVTFPVAEHVASGTVVGVDSHGFPALWQDERQRDITPSGEIEELPDSIISLQGVSADGELLLFESEDRLVVVDDTGEQVFDWPSGSGASVTVAAGHIVVTAGGSTQILRPAG